MARPNPNTTPATYTGMATVAANKYKGLDTDGRAAELRAFNMDMIKTMYQNDWSEYMWERQNEYNSTEEQLKRWIQAGGNPNAFFGGGTNTGNASSLTSATGGGYMGTPGLGLESMLKMAELTNNFWQQRKTKAEAERQEIENGTLKELNETTIEEIKANIKLKEKEGKLKGLEATQIEELLPGLKGKTNAEIEEIKEKTNLLIKQQKETEERIKNLDQDTKIKEQEKLKLEWENLFRQLYGVDPTSNAIQMLIQNILSGKGENVIQALFNYVDEGTQTTIDKVKTYEPKTANGKLVKGLLNAIYDGYKRKYKRNNWRNH